jgi:hypothetical protein
MCSQACITSGRATFTVSRWGFIGKASRLLGLHFDCVSMYKDNFTEYSNVRFEGGCFRRSMMAAMLNIMMISGI